MDDYISCHINATLMTSIGVFKQSTHKPSSPVIPSKLPCSISWTGIKSFLALFAPHCRSLLFKGSQNLCVS